jgi:hypothetical protein
MAILAGLGLHLVTRSWFIVGRLRPQLEARLGAAIAIGSASYEGGGRFMVRDLSVRSPDHEGPAAEILMVGEALIDVDLGELLRRRVRLLRVDLDRVTLRLSEDAGRSGSFNLTALQPRWESDPRRAPAWPPTITIHQATIEVGQHQGAAFELSGRRRVRGSMQPAGSEPGTFRFNLDEITEGGGRLPEGLAVEGQWDVPAERVHGQVQGLALDRRAHGMCPAAVRVWWDRMELSGRLGLAQLDLSAADGVSVSFDVDDVGLTLPVETQGLWARYQDGAIVTAAGRPRMQVRRGAIRVGPDQLVLDGLVGELRSAGADEVPSVPYEVTLHLGASDQAGWTRADRPLEEVLRTAPFTLTARARQSTGPRGEAAPAPAELPVQLARLMQRFRLRDWQLDTEVRVQRGAPRAGPDGSVMAAPLRMHGRADVLQATGAYEKFPYLLEEIRAILEFDEEAILIETLTARAAGAGRVTLAGQVGPLTGEPGVALTLKAEGLELDERLRAALRPGEQRLYDDLFHAESAESLRRAGLLPEGDEPGGAVDLDLTITRAAGPAQPTVVQGSVSLRHATVLPRVFPYPLRAVGGTLLWEPGGVRIAGDGLPITAPGGGRGRLSGAIQMERGPEGTRARPRLALAIRGNRIERRLLAAIPPDGARRAAGDWPGASLARAAQTIADMELAGDLDATGSIASDPEGALLYDLDLELHHGRARIPEAWRGGLPPHDDAAWAVDDVEGRAHVSNHEVWLDDLHGRLRESPIRAWGRIPIGGAWGEGVTVRADELRFDGASLAAAAGGAEAGLEWLRRFEPRGTMAVEYAYGGPGGGRLSVLPVSLTAAVDGEPLLLRRTQGAVAIERDRLVLDELGLAVRAGEAAQGEIRLSGEVRRGEAQPLMRLSGTWQDGRFECPILTGVVGQRWTHLGGGAVPRGAFDAEFEINAPPGPAQERLRATLRPRTLLLDRGRGTIEATFDPGSRIRVREDSIEADPVAGMLHGAGGFDVRGVIDLGPATACDLEVEFNGDLGSAATGRILPDVARSALEGMRYQDGSGSEIVQGRLKLARNATDGSWAGSFGAALVTHGAAASAGIDLSEITGRLDFELEWGPRRPVRFELAADLERFRAQGHLVEGARARAELLEDGSAIRVTDVGGTLYGGALSAAARVGLSRGRDWTIEVSVAGAGIDAFLAQAGASAAASEPRDGSEGRLYGSVALCGQRGVAASRRGRGTVRALGSVTQLPLVLRVMQVTHLTAPVLWGDPDYLDSEFFIAGDTLTFERLLFESSFGQTSPLQLLGTGDLDLRTQELDATFRSRGGWFFRDVLGEIGDQLYVIRVTGPLSNPAASVVALPGLRGTANKLSGAATPFPED